jgi:pimeloyl-ACP methyl ester carboxylesterase
MKHTNSIETSQGRFHYYDIGDSDRTIYFCHGNSLSAGSYLPFLQKVADKGFKVIAPDLRGHGFSTKEKTQAIKSWDIFIKDVEAFVSAINKPLVPNQKSQIKNQKSLIGMGHSLGGFIVYAAAALYPGLFSRIILLDPIILPPELLLFSNFIRLIGMERKFWFSRMARNKRFLFASKKDALKHYSGKGMFRYWLPEFIEAYVETAITNSATNNTVSLCCDPELEAMIFESPPLNTWKFAGQIDIPVLLVRAGNSDHSFNRAGIRLSRKIKDCRFITLEGLSHFMMMEDPDKVISAILCNEGG